MKNLIFLCTILLGLNSVAQVPAAFKYQAVARDELGNILSVRDVTFKISILRANSAGTVIYSEIHSKKTSSYGLVDLVIGNGTSPVGTFSGIDWGSDTYYVRVELDPAGGNAFRQMGTSQLLSVPYALFSQDVLNKNDADADPGNEIQVLSKAGNTVTLSKGGGSYTDAVDDEDHNPLNEIQKITISGTTLTLDNGGGSVVLPLSGGGDNWGTQTAVTNSTLTGNGTTSSPLGVVQAQLQPSWANIQGKPAEFGDDIDNVDDADADSGNEINTSLEWNNTDNTLTVSDSGGGYKDWYLPSDRELTLLTSQDYLIDHILDNDIDTATSGFSQDYNAPTYGSYWSSTEGSAAYSWVFDFGYGGIYDVTKTLAYRVRAIRKF